MSFHELYLTLNQRLEAIEQKIASVSPEELGIYLEELEALMDFQESILENWLYFDDRLQKLYLNLQEQKASVADPPLAVHEWETNLPLFTLSSAFSSWETGGQDLNGHFRKGLGFFDLQMFRDSAREFEKILQVQPDLLLIRLFYAISKLASGDRNSAEIELQNLLFATDDPLFTAAAWEARAQMFVESGEFRLAAEALTHVLAQKPEDLDAHINLAICAFVFKDYDTVKEHALFATRLDPQDALPWRLLGAANFAAANLAEAIYAYQQALQRAPEHPLIALETAHALQALKRTREAEILYHSLIQKHEREADAYMGLAEINLLAGHFHQATAYLKKRLSLKREDPRAMLWLGYALYGEQDFEHARSVFLRLIDLDPPFSYLAETGLARIAVETENLEEAKKYLRMLSAQKENKWRAHGFSEFGYLYAKTGQPERAMRFLERALDLDPTQTDASLMLSQLLPHQEPFTEMQLD